MPQFPFVGGSYVSRSTSFSDQQCLNLYVEEGTPVTKSKAMLVGTPGKQLWATIGQGPIRGGYVFTRDGIAVVVSGSEVYIVDTSGVATLCGTVDTLTTPASIDGNGIVVMIVTGPNGYVLNPITLDFVQITSPNFHGADAVKFIDGYFAFNRPGTQQFQITQLYSTDISDLDFASAEGSPDLLLTLTTNHDEIWLLGVDTTEVFFNSGNSDFTFQRINGAFIEQGCAAKYSPAEMDSTIYWLGSNKNGHGIVYRANGYQPVRISNHAMESAMAQMSRIDDAVSFTYQQEGHSFYVLNFPTAQKTWVFDSAVSNISEAWHERGWLDISDGVIKQDRAICQMFFANKTLVGDFQSGNIYELSLDVYTDNGTPIVRRRAAPYIYDGDYKYQKHSWVQIDMQVGVGLDGDPTAVGADPQARLQWSDDGGRTWSNEHLTSIGRIGQYARRVRWRRLGITRERIYRVTVSDPVPIIFIGAAAGVKTYV